MADQALAGAGAKEAEATADPALAGAENGDAVGSDAIPEVFPCVVCERSHEELDHTLASSANSQFVRLH